MGHAVVVQTNKKLKKKNIRKHMDSYIIIVEISKMGVLNLWYVFH